MSKILVLTDYPAGATSGYATILKPICNYLCEQGNEVRVLALSNRGEEHWEPFAIIPVKDLGEAIAAIHNLKIMWEFDVLILGMDIPNLESMYQKISYMQLKTIAITPLENGPLMQSWAMALSQFHRVFFISKLGEDEARKVGLKNVSHLQVGVDSDLWTPLSPPEKVLSKEMLGFSADEQIVLTVADNQERKNLWAALSIFAKTVKDTELNLRYVLVTREQAPWGYRLQELANDLGILPKVAIFERGMPQEQLRLLYGCSDVFLLTSKAEGLGLPVLEAMAMGIPCVVTDTGALHEIVSDARANAWLVPPEYTFIDVWGNSKRDMINIAIASQCLDVALHSVTPDLRLVDYVRDRGFYKSIQMVETCIKELVNETNN